MFVQKINGVDYWSIQLYVGMGKKIANEWWVKRINHFSKKGPRPPILIEKGEYSILQTHACRHGEVLNWDGETVVSLNSMLEQRHITGKVILACCCGKQVRDVYLRNGGDPEKVIFLNKSTDRSYGSVARPKLGWVTFTQVEANQDLIEELKVTPLRIK